MQSERGLSVAENKDTGFRVITSVIKPAFKMHFSPTIIGSENIPKDGAVVIAGNHKNIRDQFLVFLATDRVINYMAKREYFDGALAPLFKWAGCIPVNRDGFDAAAVRSAIKILKRGGAVGIFPEGTRNRTDKSLLAFKPGAAAIAKRGNALIVPFAISGEYRKNGNLKILFGEPFSPKSMSVEEATDKLYSAVSNLLESQ